MRKYSVLLVALLMVASASAGDEELGPRATPEGIVFTFEAPDAADVTIAGEFNGWSPTKDHLQEIGGGLWQIVLPLKPGRYEYKFVIDGTVWQEDPYSPGYVPDPYEGRNSVIIILSDGSIDWSGGKRKAGPIVKHLPPLKKPLYLAILWHQHQPRYSKDPTTGEYTEPWVRIHGIKDYYDMVAILEKYPEMKFTVNLTPVLLTQLLEIVEAYDTNRGKPGEPIPGCDKWVRLTLTPPDRLSEDDKAFILRNFFRMPRSTMIEIYPRFAELASKKLGDSDKQIKASIARLTDQDWRDLQAWFNLAEFDPDFKERDVRLPDGQIVGVQHLIAKGRDFTEAEKSEIIEAQFEILRNIIPVHKKFQDLGQIEVVTSPYYHPILPLLCDTGVAREANPGIELPSRPFEHPEDAERQIEMACDYYQALFGKRPPGMWPSEGAVSEAIIPLIADAGIDWIASDEEVLAQSLRTVSLTAAQKYQMYYLPGIDHRVAIIFRDHELSDDIGFRYSKMDGMDAANDMIRKLYDIASELQNVEGDFVVPIIMDGENAWEHFEHDGKEFLNAFYSQVSDADWLVPVTISEFLKNVPPRVTLDHLSPGSWIAGNFDTWIGEEEENLAWSYLTDARDFIATKRDHIADKTLAEMMEQIYIAEGSDWFWWYGLDQGSGNDEVFDRAFRSTLARVYELAGEGAPGHLFIPIVKPLPAKPSRKITAMMVPTIDGMMTEPDEWNASAYVDDSEEGIMQESIRGILHGLYYGYDSDRLYLRLDTEWSRREFSSSNCALEVYLSGTAETNAYVNLGTASKLYLDFAVATRVRIAPDGNGVSAEIDAADGVGGWRRLDEAEYAMDEIVEIAVPFEMLRLQGGENLRFVAIASCDGKVEDRIPNDSYLELKVPIGGLKLLRFIEDPVGDDKGPGYYSYPTDAVFGDGCFDITSLEVSLDASDNLIFRIGVRGDLSAPWGGVTGYSLQAVDIYIDTDGIPNSGTRDLFRARKARTVPEHAWEYFIRACMDTVALYDARGARLDVNVKSYPDEVTSSIYVTLPRDAISGSRTWNVIVAMLGHDGYSFGEIRPVEAVASQWYFGGCDDDQLCPSIIDLVVEPGASQYDVLSAYRRTHRLVEIDGIQIRLM